MKQIPGSNIIVIGASIGRSISALDKAFAQLGKDRVSEIISKIDAKNIPGPTLEEYIIEQSKQLGNESGTD